MMYFIFNKKHCLAGCIIFACVGLLLGSLISAAVHALPNRKSSSPVIIVDAGHGLPDGGAIGFSGTVEQGINLAIANKLKEILSAKGIRVIMTRTDENGIWTNPNADIRTKKLEDMHSRMNIMKNSNASLFISIHMNSHQNKSASGLRIFYSEKHSSVKPLAENIQCRMSDVTGAATSVVKSADSKLYLLKNPPIPAILVECGFLSNETEEKKLKDDDYQARLAWAIADAVEKYYSFPFVNR